MKANIGNAINARYMVALDRLEKITVICEEQFGRLTDSLLMPVPIDSSCEPDGCNEVMANRLDGVIEQLERLSRRLETTTEVIKENLGSCRL